MLNIISKSILEKRIRGPKKVVKNLLASLDQIGYPYVLNRALDATNMLWIHDDISALWHLKDLPSRVKVIIGPNLFVNPENIPPSLDLGKTLYLQPSAIVEEVWKKRGFNKTIMAIWAVGVGTDIFQPSNLEKEYVLLYFKNRKEEELKEVISILEKIGVEYRLIRYGQYDESEFYETLSKSKYIIWLGGSESQGLALEEALSMNVPALVIDEGKVEYGAALSAAPYFSEDCGRKIENLSDLSAAISTMEKDYRSFHPHDFIIQNLSLERQAHQFLNFYEDHFHFSVDQGKHEKLQNNKLWRNARAWFKAYVRLKEMLKSFL